MFLVTNHIQVYIIQHVVVIKITDHYGLLTKFIKKAEKKSKSILAREILFGQKLLQRSYPSQLQKNPRYFFLSLTVCLFDQPNTLLDILFHH